MLKQNRPELDNSLTTDADCDIAGPGRALMVLTPAAERRPRIAVHRASAFVAHLIAIKDQHPQTRERRRAEPDVATRAYRSVLATGKR